MSKKRGSLGVAVIPSRYGGEKRLLWIKFPYRWKPSRRSTENQKHPLGYYLLWIVVVVLLVLNLSILYILFAAWQRVGTALQQVETYRQKFETAISDSAAILEDMKDGSFDYVVKIDEEMPITADIPVDFEAKVPLSMTIPVSTSISVPFNGVTVTIPINANVPINTTVTLPVQTTIPISTTVPVKLDIPVHIKIADTSLAKNLSDLQALLDRLNSYLSGFSLDFLSKP